MNLIRARRRADGGVHGSASSLLMRTPRDRARARRGARRKLMLFWNSALSRAGVHLAPEVDNLYFFILARHGVLRRCWSSVLVMYFAVKYRDDTGLKVGAPNSRVDSARARLVAHPVHHLDGDLRLGHRRVLRVVRPPDQTLEIYCHRQALDVALPAHRRPARDQRAARPGGPAGQGDLHVRRRAARPLHSRRSASRPTPFPAATARSGSRRPRPASTICSARSTAAPGTPA